jgi:hypothetical protein
MTAQETCAWRNACASISGAMIAATWNKVATPAV